MNGAILEFPGVYLGDKKSKGILTLTTKSIEFEAKNTECSFSENIVDFSMASIEDGIDKILFGKKPFIVICTPKRFKFRVTEENAVEIINSFSKGKDIYDLKKHKEEIISYVERKRPEIDNAIVSVCDNVISICKSFSRTNDSLADDLKFLDKKTKQQIDFSVYLTSLIFKYNEELSTMSDITIKNVISDYVNKIINSPFDETKSLEQNIECVKTNYSDVIDSILANIKTEDDCAKYAEAFCKHSKSLYELFMLNPYYILGLPCTAGRSEALEVNDKIEKYTKLKITKAFKSEFDYKNIAKPSRDLSAVQAAIVKLKEDKYKWFAQKESTYSKIWDLPVIFDLLNKNELCYDLFLASYLHLLIKDSDIADAKKWKSFLKVFDVFMAKSEHSFQKVLTNHIGIEVDDNKLGSFKSSICEPLIVLIKSLPVTGLSNFKKVILSCKLKSAFLKNELSEPLVQLAVYEQETLGKNYDKDDGLEHISTQRYNDISGLSKEAKTKLDIIKDIIEELSGQNSPYYGRLGDVYEQYLRDLLTYYIQKNRLAFALPYAKELYALGTDEDQRKLKNNFGYEKLGLTLDDLDSDEINDMAIEKMNEGQKTEGIKLMKKSADMGNNFAQSNLAFRYLEGNDGVTKNIYTAISLFKKSAYQGNETAQFALFQIFFDQDKGHQDINEAMRWLRKACDQSFEPAMNVFNNIVDLAKNGNYQEHNMAIELLKKMGLDV